MLTTMMPDHYRLQDSLGYQFSRTARILERGFEDNLKALGLTRITWCILLAVGVERFEKPSEIASFIGIDRTAASRALRQMEADGLIRRKAGSKDRRTTLVALTIEGARLMDIATQHARENASRYHEKLTATERQTLGKILNKLRDGEDPTLSHI